MTRLADRYDWHGLWLMVTTGRSALRRTLLRGVPLGVAATIVTDSLVAATVVLVCLVLAFAVTDMEGR